MLQNYVNNVVEPKNMQHTISPFLYPIEVCYVVCRLIYISAFFVRTYLCVEYTYIYIYVYIHTVNEINWTNTMANNRMFECQNQVLSRPQTSLKLPAETRGGHVKHSFEPSRCAHVETLSLGAPSRALVESPWPFSCLVLRFPTAQQRRMSWVQSHACPENSCTSLQTMTNPFVACWFLKPVNFELPMCANRKKRNTYQPTNK